MALETVTHISDLVVTNPTNTDPKSQGDDHFRAVKTALKTDLPNITGVVNASHTELNYMVGATTQPAMKDGSNLTTPALGDSSTKIATTAFVAGTAFAAVLPAQTGNAGKFITTNGTVASWAYAGISTINATITTSTTLTGTYLYVPVQMSALGQSITLPNAATLSVGGPQYVIDNTKGGYPVGIRDNTGTLVMAVAAGGEALVSLKDNSTAAGVWSVTGSNLEPGLITIDNTFSSTYASTVLKPFVALDSNKSIHFLSVAAGGLSAVCVDNLTGTVGTPVVISGSGVPVSAAFKVTATTAIVFFNSNQTIVLSLSGSTTLTASAVVNALGGSEWAAEDFSGAPKIAQLSSTLYLASYTSGTNTSVVAVSVSGTTVTIGTAANIITANSVSNSTTTYALTATTALVLYKSGAAAPYANNAVVISVSGTTCTVGTPAALTGVASSAITAASSCLLSASKCLVHDNNNGSALIASVFTIAGTTVTAGTAVTVEATVGNVFYTTDSATRYNPHLFPLSSSTALLWYLDSSGISRAAVLSESGGTVTAGTITLRSISAAASGSAGFGRVMPQGTNEFCSVFSTVASSAGSGLQIVPTKIAGTTLSVGAAKPVRNLSPVDPSSVYATRLASGDYLPIVSSSGFALPSCIPVFRSNGDAINYRGEISIPPIGNVQTTTVAVSSNRAVILGSTTINYQSGGAQQLRLLNVEIAQ